MILGPDGQPMTPATAPLVAPDGTPVTAEEPRQMTMADLQALLLRMGAAADRLSAHHPHRQLFVESGQWMANLARQCVELTAQLVAIREGVINPDGSPVASEPKRDWRGLSLVRAGDTDEEQSAS